MAKPLIYLLERRARTYEPVLDWNFCRRHGGIALVLAIKGDQAIHSARQAVPERAGQYPSERSVRRGDDIIKYEDAISAGTKATLTYYHVMYSYKYEGKTYTREQEVPKEIYLAFPDKTQVSVHFLPADPTQVVTNIDLGIK